MTDNLPKLITLLELAERLRISPHTVRKMTRDGRLHPVRLCRRLLYSPSEVLRLLGEAEANEKAADSQSAAKAEVRRDRAIPHI
jgi:excisionase family DNA binding protein